MASIDQTTLDQPINVGTSVRITCSGRGDPPPSYMWFKEDKNGKYEGYHNIIKMLQVTTCTCVTKTITSL